MINYTEDMSMLAVKLLIQDKEGIPPSAQVLSYSGRIRHSHDFLRDIEEYERHIDDGRHDPIATGGDGGVLREV